MTEDLRGVFYIIRGGYDKSKGPKFFNEVSESYNSIGGYDPEDTSNREWYMLFDSVTFICHLASSDFDRVCSGVYRLITTYKTRENFLNTLSKLDIPSSPINLRLEKEVFKEYGDYYTTEIREQEDLAYEHIRNTNPVVRARKLVKRRDVSVEMEHTPHKENTTPPTPSGTPHKRKGLRPVKRT